MNPLTAAGLPGIATVAAGLFLFAATLVVRRWQRPAESGGRRDPLSIPGIALQGAAFVVAASGPVRVTLNPLGGAALGMAAAVALLVSGALSLFLWTTATMGRQWSLIARTRSDHRLVTHGPFAHVRHPIYVALAAVVVALALALGHGPRLVPALIVYALGTALRVRSEERLLATAFGTDHAAYTARVKRFLPGLF